MTDEMADRVKELFGINGDKSKSQHNDVSGNGFRKKVLRDLLEVRRIGIH
jgi:uncharacterized protein (UPF0335 family)